MNYYQIALKKGSIIFLESSLTLDGLVNEIEEKRNFIKIKKKSNEKIIAVSVSGIDEISVTNLGRIGDSETKQTERLYQLKP